jgi:hypothetical protein
MPRTTTRSTTRRLAAATTALVLAATMAGTASAAGSGKGRPVFRESQAYTDRFFDDVIWELCGIETWTTLKERWTFTEYADGSAHFQNVRTFIPDDVRIPIERGAGSSHTTPDGTRTVTGAPFRVYDRQGGGVMVIAAGNVKLDPDGSPLRIAGQLPDMSDEALAGYYCPD